jgi:hypothetical protein
MFDLNNSQLVSQTTINPFTLQEEVAFHEFIRIYKAIVENSSIVKVREHEEYLFLFNSATELYNMFISDMFYTSDFEEMHSLFIKCLGECERKGLLPSQCKRKTMTIIELVL